MVDSFASAREIVGSRDLLPKSGAASDRDFASRLCVCHQRDRPRIFPPF